MSGIARFEDITAWQLARQLCGTIYALTRKREFARDWALRDQITLAAGSIMHNIAEGFDAGSDTEFVRFLNYAKRSCSEVQSELYLALDQGYISNEEFTSAYRLGGEVRAAITGFINYLKESP